jgi:hypothetical protein
MTPHHIPKLIFLTDKNLSFAVESPFLFQIKKNLNGTWTTTIKVYSEVSSEHISNSYEEAVEYANGCHRSMVRLTQIMSIDPNYKEKLDAIDTENIDLLNIPEINFIQSGKYSLFLNKIDTVPIIFLISENSPEHFSASVINILEDEPMLNEIVPDFQTAVNKLNEFNRFVTRMTYINKFTNVVDRDDNDPSLIETPNGFLAMSKNDLFIIKKDELWTLKICNKTHKEPYFKKEFDSFDVAEFFCKILILGNINQNTSN